MPDARRAPSRRAALFPAALLATLALVGCEARELPPLAPPIDVGPAPDTRQPDSGPPIAPPGLSPSSGSMAGYFEVTLDLAGQPLGPSAVDRVELGGRAGIWLTPDDERLRFTVQGHPTPGPVELVIFTADGEQVVPDAFTYDPPRLPEVLHIVSLGASVSQGFQAGGMDAEGALGSPPAWIARQMGAYLGIPLFADDMFPSMSIEDMAPPPLCETPGVTDWVTRSVGLLVPKLSRIGGGVPLAAGGRIDPTLLPSHLAISGSTVGETLHGPQGGGAAILAHLVYAVDGTILDPVPLSPIEQAEALAPDILLAFDFYGNDVLLDDPEPTEAAEQALRDRLVADIDGLVQRMALTGAEVFVGDIPPSSIMPDWRLARAVRLRDAEPGTEEAVAAQADVDVAIIDARTRVANEALYAAAARFENVHLVPTAQAVLDVLDAPLIVGGEPLTWEMFGGLVGLDGVHFTDVGYAHNANLALAVINAVFDADIPLVDLEAVMATDPESPAAMRAIGIPVDECVR